MGIAQLILDYIDSLIWPGLVATLLIAYKDAIDTFIRRLSEETEEVESSLLGLSAKFRKEMSEISDEIESGDRHVREKVRAKIKDFAKSQFRVISANFFSQPLRVRRRAAQEIEELAEELSIDDFIEFAESAVPGERVGAGIALKVMLKRDQNILDSDRVRKTIRKGVTDSYSRVRYRYVEALAENRSAADHFIDIIEEVAQSDQNSAVRSKANEII